MLIGDFPAHPPMQFFLQKNILLRIFERIQFLLSISMKKEKKPPGCKRSPLSKDLVEPPHLPTGSGNSTLWSCRPKIFTASCSVVPQNFKLPGSWRSRKTSYTPSPNIHRHPSVQVATVGETPPLEWHRREKSKKREYTTHVAGEKG